MKKLIVLVVVVMALSLVALAPVGDTINVDSSKMNFSGSGWGGWSCPSTYPLIVSGRVEALGEQPVVNQTLWKPGASVAGFTYPNTPSGYTYGTGEQGFIVQNGNPGGAGQKIILHLVCGKPAPVPTPIPPISCKLQKQSYGLAELWNSGGDYATLYIYPDKNGKLPIGVGVERQQCVLGWTAARSGMFDFVYKDTCTGVYYFNGSPITPRADVLEKNVCARNGACR